MAKLREFPLRVGLVKVEAFWAITSLTQEAPVPPYVLPGEQACKKSPTLVGGGIHLSGMRCKFVSWALRHGDLHVSGM